MNTPTPPLPVLSPATGLLAELPLQRVQVGDGLMHVSLARPD